MYLAFYAADNSAKNKLEKDIREYLKSLDRTVIQDADFSDFTNKILEKIKEINNKNKRSKPKTAFLWSTGNTQNKDFMLSGINVVNFYFYHSSKDYREGVVFIDRV